MPLPHQHCCIGWITIFGLQGLRWKAHGLGIEAKASESIRSTRDVADLKLSIIELLLWVKDQILGKERKEG